MTSKKFTENFHIGLKLRKNTKGTNKGETFLLKFSRIMDENMDNTERSKKIETDSKDCIKTEGKKAKQERKLKINKQKKRISWVKKQKTRGNI